MQKRNIRAPTWLTAVGAILLIVSVFGLTFQLFRIPDSFGDTSGSGNSVVIPTPDDDIILPFDGACPENVVKIKGDLNKTSSANLSVTDTETGYTFVQEGLSEGNVFIDSGNNSDFSDISYLTVDFDLTVKDFKNTILFTPAFCYEDQLKLETLGFLKFTSDKKIYCNYNSSSDEFVCSYTDDSLHITFVYCDGMYSKFGTATCSTIFCYVDGKYIGQIAGYQSSRKDYIYFNGLRIASIVSSAYGTEFSIDNVEIFSYSKSYEPKNFDTILNTNENIYNCMDWCYYKKNKY